MRDSGIRSQPDPELQGGTLVNSDASGTWRYHWRSTISSDFIRKVAETYATRVLLIGVGLVTTVIVARLLGPAGRGYYAVATATGVLGVQFGNLGLHTSNVYFAARNPRRLPLLIGNSLVVGLGVGGALAVILAMALRLMPGLVSIDGRLLFLALLWIPLGITYLLLQDLLLGVQDVRGYNVLELGTKVIPLLLMGAIVLFWQPSVARLFSAAVAGLLATCLFSMKRLRQHFGGWPRPSLSLFRISFRYAAKAYLATFFGFLVLRADLFMVQHILGPEQSGYYSIASTMADTVYVLAIVVGTVLFPKLSALRDNHAKLRLTYQAAGATAAALLPILVSAALLAKWVVRLLFGVAFLPAAQAFVLLMPGMLFLGVESVTVQFLNSIGFPRIVVVIWALCTVFNVTLNLWAIPHYSIAGAAVTSSLSYFLAFVLIVKVIRKHGREIAEAVAI
jgi:O-antigen/teichoic acid export membrane protein